MSKEKKVEKFHGVGRRKNAVARVHLKPGKGDIIINKRPLNEFFTIEISQMIVCQPLVTAGLRDKFDIQITVAGGGTTGQAGAARLGVSRALLEYDPDLRAVLKPEGFLTRDARRVERQKIGLKGARAGKQWSKR